MPTYDWTESFTHDLKTLTRAERQAFQKAVQQFVEDLRKGEFRKGLRVKKMQGHADVWEMTWAADGRATFSYGDAVIEGEKHVIWRRIGDHKIFGRP